MGGTECSGVLNGSRVPSLPSSVDPRWPWTKNVGAAAGASWLEVDVPCPEDDVVSDGGEDWGEGMAGDGRLEGCQARAIVEAEDGRHNNVIHTARCERTAQ